MPSWHPTDNVPDGLPCGASAPRVQPPRSVAHTSTATQPRQGDMMVSNMVETNKTDATDRTRGAPHVPVLRVHHGVVLLTPPSTHPPARRHRPSHRAASHGGRTSDPPHATRVASQHNRRSAPPPTPRERCQETTAADRCAGGRALIHSRHAMQDSAQAGTPISVNWRQSILSTSIIFPEWQLAGAKPAASARRRGP